MAEDELPKRIWVHSNRKDDRVVLWERDRVHPNGEAFVGGDGAVLVAETPEVLRLKREGVIIEVPEPPKQIDGKDNRKLPQVDTQPSRPLAADQPGEPIQLGRDLDPEVVPESAMASIKTQQERAGTSVPSQATVPPDSGSTKDAVRR